MTSPDSIAKIIKTAIGKVEARGKTGKTLLQPAIAMQLRADGLQADVEDTLQIMPPGMPAWRSKNSGTVVPMRIPAHVGPQFRGMPGQDSGRCRPPFRRMPAGVDVGRVNHGYRGLFSSGKGIDGGAAEVTRAEDSRDLAAQGRWIQ